MLVRATRGDPDSVIEAIHEFGEKQQWLMGVGDLKGRILDSRITEALASKPQGVVVEMGAYCGYSAVRIARLLTDDQRLISLELNPDFAIFATQIVELAGLKHRVDFVVGPAAEGAS